MSDVENNERSLKEKIFIIKDWVNFFLLKWKIILLVGLIGGALGLTLAVIQKPNYIATSSFVLEDEKASVSGALGMASQLGFDFGMSSNNAFTGLNFIELMKSRNITEKALLNSILVNGKKISFADYYINFNEWRESWKDDAELKNINFPLNVSRKNYTLKQDSILGEIYRIIIEDNLEVLQKNQKISIIYVNVSSENELFSKYFTEALVTEVSDYYIETKSKKSKLNLDIIERQTDSVKAELTNAITAVAVANDNIFNLNPSLNVNRVPSVRKQVDVQANTAILSELVKNLELAKLTLRKETPLIQIIDSPIFPLEIKKVGKVVGLILGGLLGGIVILFYLGAKRYWQKEMID